MEGTTYIRYTEDTGYVVEVARHFGELYIKTLLDCDMVRNHTEGDVAFLYGEDVKNTNNSELRKQGISAKVDCFLIAKDKGGALASFESKDVANQWIEDQGLRVLTKKDNDVAINGFIEDNKPNILKAFSDLKNGYDIEFSFEDLLSQFKIYAQIRKAMMKQRTLNLQDLISMLDSFTSLFIQYYGALKITGGDPTKALIITWLKNNDNIVNYNTMNHIKTNGVRLPLMEIKCAMMEYLLGELNTGAEYVGLSEKERDAYIKERFIASMKVVVNQLNIRK